ncbi:MAG: biopolymer transporter ExbD [Elusimicrobia bacterium]|nr:biopolymer transporter ExbD [Elusimicrobiota bacterium]
MAARYLMTRLRFSVPEAEPVTEVNIIPVIDISLVLLVILFISAPLLSYPSLPIELPRAFVPQTGESTLTLTYTAKGELAVGMDMSDWQSLDSKLGAAFSKSPGATLVLRVDKTVPYRVIERLMAVAKKNGVKKIALATERPR